MALQEKLDAMREMSKARIPPEARAIMERIARVGQTAPPFTLPDADGRSVSLAELTAHGPVVLSFYRGRW
jgi:hypothetical protein